MAEGALVERVRFERKKERAADYLATLRRLGFDPGPDGPVTWERAEAATRFMEERRRAVLTGACGDVTLPPPAAPAPLFQAAAPATTAAATTTAAGPPPSTVGSVLLPPQPPASPVQPGQAAEGAGPSS